MLINNRNKATFRHHVMNDKNLNQKEKWLLVILIEYYNIELGYAYPSIKRLSELSSIGTTKVKEVIKSLKEKGYINYTVGHTGKSNQYVIIDVWTNQTDNSIPKITPEQLDQIQKENGIYYGQENWE